MSLFLLLRQFSHSSRTVDRLFVRWVGWGCRIGCCGYRSSLLLDLGLHGLERKKRRCVCVCAGGVCGEERERRVEPSSVVLAEYGLT